MNQSPNNQPITAEQFVRSFRESAPYIEAHSGRTFVLAFSGEVAAEAALNELLRDVALIHALGVRWVIVHGARPQIDAALAAMNIDAPVVDGIRVTTQDAIAAVNAAAGSLRLQIEAKLSAALGARPHGVAGSSGSLKVVSGNLLTAKPRGVVNGTDYQHTGEVRKVAANAMHKLLSEGMVVLLSPVGYSPSGEGFNLAFQEVAKATAIGINADKLIYVTAENLPEVAGSLTAAAAIEQAEGKQAKNNGDVLPDIWQAIAAAVKAGVPRGHLVSLHTEGALLRELYTRDGGGILVTGGHYDQLRIANINDIGGLMDLIAPLEADGTLAPRSREQLELDIDHFSIIERDGRIIASAALFPFQSNGVGELACLAVHPDYRDGARGDQLLLNIEQRAKELGLDEIFILTTRAEHWFRERGFQAVGPDALPMERKALYNWQRNSKVFLKAL